MNLRDSEEQGRRGWLCTLRRQAMRGLTFEVELALAEQATRAGQWEQAEVHVTMAIQRLETEGFDYSRWARCVDAYVHLHLEQCRPDLAIQVLRFAAVDMCMREGSEHLLTLHFKSELSSLQWATVCDEAESNLTGANVRLSLERPPDHEEMIEAMARRHHSWDRCLGYADLCLAHGQFYWAEVACWAAMMPCGGADDSRFLGTVERLCTVYMQADAPTFAEGTIRWAIKECLESLGKEHSSTGFLVRQLAVHLMNQGRKGEAETLRCELLS